MSALVLLCCRAHLSGAEAEAEADDGGHGLAGSSGALPSLHGASEADAAASLGHLEMMQEEAQRKRCLLHIRQLAFTRWQQCDDVTIIIRVVAVLVCLVNNAN